MKQTFKTVLYFVFLAVSIVLITLMHLMPMVLILLISVALHEMAHALAAKREGLKTDSFRLGFGPVAFTKGRFEFCYLWFLGGGCIFDNEAFMNVSPQGRVKITAAGPLMNYLISFACYMAATAFNVKKFFITTLSLIPSFFTALGGAFTQTETMADTGATLNGMMANLTMPQMIRAWLVIASLFNFLLFVANIIPFPALDGSEILVSGLECFGKKIDRRKVDLAASVGATLLLVFSITYLCRDAVMSLGRMV